MSTIPDKGVLDGGFKNQTEVTFLFLFILVLVTCKEPAKKW